MQWTVQTLLLAATVLFAVDVPLLYSFVLWNNPELTAGHHHLLWAPVDAANLTTAASSAARPGRAVARVGGTAKDNGDAESVRGKFEQKFAGFRFAVENIPCKEEELALQQQFRRHLSPLSISLSTKRLVALQLRLEGIDDELMQWLKSWIALHSISVLAVSGLKGWTEVLFRQAAVIWGFSFSEFLVASTGENFGIMSKTPVALVGKFTSASSPSVFTHGLLHVLVDSLHVLVAHLAPSPALRRKEAAYITALVAKLSEDGRGVVLVGPLNSLSPQDSAMHSRLPTSPAAQIQTYITDGIADYSVLKLLLAVLSDPFANLPDDEKATFPSTPSDDLPLRLDFALVNSVVMQSYGLRAKVLRSQAAAMFSDHFAVELLLCADERGGGGRFDACQPELDHHLRALQHESALLRCLWRQQREEAMAAALDSAETIAKNKQLTFRLQQHQPYHWSPTVGQAGQSCRHVCAASHAAPVCVAAALASLANCDRLATRFPCFGGCRDSGVFDPALPAGEIVADHSCHSPAAAQGAASCDAASDSVRLLCPCGKPPPPMPTMAEVAPGTVTDSMKSYRRRFATQWAQQERSPHAPFFVVTADTAESCDAACSRSGSKCLAQALSLLNNCDRLHASFPCMGGCLGSEGPDQPAYVSLPSDQNYGRCLYSSVPSNDCASSHPVTSRVCPCLRSQPSA